MSDLRLPQRINGEFADVPALTAPDIGKALTVASTSLFTYTAFATSAEVTAAIAAHVVASDPHSQYHNDARGDLRYQPLDSDLTAIAALATTVFGRARLTDADAPALRSAAALGTAAVLNVGVAASNIVQLDGSAKLPAVDGSQLTNLPSGGTPGGSDTYVQFNDGGALGGDAGLVYAKATDVLTGTGRLVMPKWSPASDSTTALIITKADGTTAVINVNTTSAIVTVTGNITSPGGGSLSEKFGAGATAGGGNAVAFGNAAAGTGAVSVAIGYAAGAQSTGDVAIGQSAVASGGAAGAGSVAIGRGAIAAGNGAVAFGQDSNAAGSNAVAMGRASSAGHQSAFAVGFGAVTTAVNQLVMGSATSGFGINDVYVGNGVVNTSPAATKFNATGGSGTNIAGAALRLAGGKGTGNAAGGEVEIQTSDAGASGTTLQTLTTKLKITSAGLLDFLATMTDSTKVPGTDAPVDWLEIKIGGVTRYIPAYAA